MFKGNEITFKEKMRLAEANPNLTKLGTGSARVVFEIDLTNGTRRGPSVMKIAKNHKGFRQNLAEANIYVNYDLYPPFMPPMISWDDNDECDTAWISVMKASKFSAQAFWNHFGITFDQFSAAVSAIINNQYDPHKENPKLMEFVEFVRDNDLMLGEFRQQSNWGTYNGMPVIIDAGVTHTNYEIVM